MQIWGLTDPGNIRQQNQDTYEIVSFGHDRALMIVCDGMGGAKSGNIASSMAAETFVAEVRRCQKLATGTERVISILKGALELANQKFKGWYEKVASCTLREIKSVRDTITLCRNME